MKIYAIRHGETDWNKLNKAQGQTDIELNKTGINQAIVARDSIQKLNIDLIISSPLKRAAKTAELVSDGKLEIIFDDRLKERYFGKLEGTNAELMAWQDLYDCNKNLSHDNIEPVNDLLKRVESLLIEIRQKYSDKNIIIFRSREESEEYLLGL